MIKIKSTPIDVYSRIKTDKTSVFVRKTGMTLDKFEELLCLIRKEIALEQAENKMRMRGRKSDVTFENQLLICLYYIRDYTTLLKLGDTFGVSESYVCKIHSKMSKYILRVLKLPSKSTLKTLDLTQVIVDVTEQAIERPVESQKESYSGKKKDIP